MSEERSSTETRNPEVDRKPFLIDGVKPSNMPTYESLARFGVDVDSSMPEIRLAGQRGQVTRDADGKSLWTNQVREHFRMLTVSPRRLLLDLFYVQTDPLVFQAEPDSTSGSVNQNPKLTKENDT